MTVKGLRELRADCARALADLGVDGEAAFDGWLDPVGLSAALAAGGPVLLRAALPLSDAAEAGCAAEPHPGYWLVVRPGQDEMQLAPLRGDAPARAVRRRGVRLERDEELCCDSPKCARGKWVASLWIDADAPLLVAEALCAGDPDEAPLAAIRDALEGRPVEAAAGTPLSAMQLARWSLRREGGVFVLRDHASRGPRDAAPVEWMLSAVFLVAGAVAWYGSWAAWQAHDWEHLAIAGALALVFTFFVVTMALIARHSSRYRADSAALALMVRDRLIVAPWHSRSGAVRVDAGGGRYGAPMALSEVERIVLVPERRGHALRCETAHGPMDVGVLEDEAQAARWHSAFERWLASLRHGPQAAVVAVLALLVGCGPAAEPDVPPAVPPPTPGATAGTPPATASSVAPVTPDPKPTPLEMIEDDVPRAMAKGKDDGRAVFIEVWAPWCHTCLSMKNFVLPDPSIVALADRVVFAAIDSDRPENADFMSRYEVNAWPTLFVIDPKDGGVLGLWQGAASAKELRAFIVDAVDARDAKSDGALGAMLDAKKAHATGDWKKAAQHYQLALDRGGADWPRGDEARFGLMFAAYRQKEWDRCATLGAEHVADIDGAALPADFAYVVLDCAGRSKEPALKKRARDAAIARLKKHTDSPPADASVDDKSDALAMYAGALRQIGDKAGARRAIEKQAALLEAAAARAPGPTEAATFDYARMGAYLALGRGAEAVAMLTERTKQLPDGYEPFARLAQALMSLERHRDAVAPLDQAIANAYGPRKLSYLSMKADLHEKLGDAAATTAALEAVLAAYEALPAGMQSGRWAELAKNTRERLAKRAR